MAIDIHDSDAMGAIYARKERIRAMIYHRAVEAYWRAMGAKERAPATATLNICHMHNSMVSRDNGQPWREIDYSQMRLALRLADKAFEPSQIVNRLFERRWRETYRATARA